MHHCTYIRELYGTVCVMGNEEVVMLRGAIRVLRFTTVGLAIGLQVAGV